MAKIYFKEIPAFITKISNHIGYQVQIFQVKDMYNGDYECFSSEEDRVKSYLDCYIFLLNNVPNVICKSIVEKAIFIMSQKRVNKSKLEEVISEFISIKEERNIKKIINISFNLSSLIRNNKDKYIFRLMIMNYLLLHYHYKAIKYYRGDFQILDQYLKEYSNGNKENLENYIINKEVESKELSEDYYKNLKEVTLEEIVEFIKINQEEFIKKYRIDSLAIFGSFAKGKERLDSDIDIMIRFEDFVPLLKRNQYVKEIEDKLFNKFNRFSDIHVENEIMSEQEIKIFKDNIKVI